MKKLSLGLFLLVILLAVGIRWASNGNEKNETVGSKKVIVEELPLVPLKAGSVKPRGWMLDQMQRDIKTGLAGNYEQIWPNVALNLYKKQERKPGNVKVIRNDKEGRQPAWWAGEHEGYWKDALVRLSFLTDDKHFQDRAKSWMEDILAAARENNGYIGIYSPESRLPLEGVDGELWTQSRIFQAMLAYYEFTGDKEVLEAVEKAALLTLNTYKKEGTYFGRPGKGPKHGGVSHGIGFLDTLEWLYRLTGKDEYKEGLVWFYDDFSKHPNRDGDMRLEELLEEDRVFYRHTPHIMEGLHGPQMASVLAKDRAELKEAADIVLPRLEFHTSPSGNFVGDENVKGRKGTSETWGEYCSMTEGVSSLNKIVAWGKSFEAADQIENTVFNAAQAARFHPNNVAIQYLGKDNQFSAADGESHNGRFVYSGYHRAAACCTLNSTRIIPFYIDGMWYSLKDDEGLFAMLFGDSEMKTEIKGVGIRVNEETFYPFEDKITFHLKPEEEVAFKFKIRIPKGAGDVKIEAGEDAQIEKNKDYITIEKSWNKEDRVVVDFDFQTKIEVAKDSTSYVSRGPLVYSLPIPAKIEKIEELKLIGGKKSGFYQYAITPEVDEDYWNLSILKDQEFEAVTLQKQDKLNPWGVPPIGVRGKMVDKNGQLQEVTLLPHGSSHLRRLTFPIAKK